MTDYTRLITGLVPKLDGESAVRHRTALVDVVNADGTVDLDFDGTIIPDVSVLDGVAALAGDVVQVIAWAGDLLVLGRARTSDTGTMARYYTTTTSGGPSSGTTQLQLGSLTIPDQGYDYTIIPSAFWTGTNDTSLDQFLFRVRVSLTGTTLGQIDLRHATANLRQPYSVPNCDPVLIAAGNAGTLIASVTRVLGTGTVNTNTVGVLAALVIPT